MTGVSGEDSGTASYHAPVVQWQEEKGGATGSSRISSVGVRSTITVSFAVPSWQRAMRRSPFPFLFLVTTKDRCRCSRYSGWLDGWLAS